MLLRRDLSTTGDLLRTGGALAAGLSLAVSLLIVLVANEYAGGIQLLVLGPVFFGGLGCLLAGQVMLWRKRPRS
ncbi:MAG: hypothetical protein HYX96_01980 [Chloroflexi bacterium]|nr:hypothetical protein [Chloroflexota bacterium]